jgi:hypothetical protein
MPRAESGYPDEGGATPREYRFPCKAPLLVQTAIPLCMAGAIRQLPLGRGEIEPVGWLQHEESGPRGANGDRSARMRVWLEEDRKQNDDQQNSNDCVDHVEHLLSASELALFSYPRDRS